MSVYAHYSNHSRAHLTVAVPRALITVAEVCAFLLLHFELCRISVDIRDLRLHLNLLACMYRVHGSSQKHLTPHTSNAFCTLGHHDHVSMNQMHFLQPSWNGHIMCSYLRNMLTKKSALDICSLLDVKIVVLQHLTTLSVYQ